MKLGINPGGRRGDEDGDYEDGDDGSGGGGDAD